MVYAPVRFRGKVFHVGGLELDHVAPLKERDSRILADIDPFEPGRQVHLGNDGSQTIQLHPRLAQDV